MAYTPVTEVQLLAAGEVNLRGNWDKIWSAVAGDSKATLILSIIGTIIVVFSVIMWFWAKRRRNPGSMAEHGSSRALIGAMGVGILFVAPGILIPLCLGIFDIVANIIIRLVKPIIG